MDVNKFVLIHRVVKLLKAKHSRRICLVELGTLHRTGPLGRIRKAELYENRKAKFLTIRPNRRKTGRPNFTIRPNI